MYPDRFGPYVLVQPLGEGGMGKVALALCDDGGRERICVVKRLHAKYLKDPRYRQRFDDEAALSRRLSHPNLVDTLAAGEVDGEPFIAQGFVDGRDLSEFIGRIRSQRIQVPVSLWIHIVHQVAQGLAYAHDFENLGLVHRDINPPNIRIGFSGEVKLLDFGLAKWKDKSSQTVQGSLLGKTAYISPEQLKNEPPDRRSDLYVLGIVLWELLAGQLFGTVLKDGRLVYAEGDRSALARLFSPVVVPPSQFAPSVTVALEAYNELGDVLDESDDPWVSAHHAQLKDSRAMVEKHIGSLRVWGTPEGAHVKLEGEVLGLLPMRSPVQVVAGRGTVLVQMTGYEPAQRPVEITPGETANIVISLHPVAAAPSASPLPVAPAPPPRAPAFQPASAQISPAFAEHLRDMHTYRWVGLLTGTVLLGVSIPTFIWLKKQDPNRSLTTKDDALIIATSAGVALGSCGMVMGIMSWIYLGLYEPASPAHASLGSPYLMMGGRF